MANNNEKIFRIVVDYKTASENLERVKESLKRVNESSRALNIEHNKLTKEFKKGSMAEDEYKRKSEAIANQQIENRKTIIALNDEKRKATIETNKLAIAENAQKGSINELNARLTAMRIKYRELTPEQRDNLAVGGALLKQINKTAVEYKKLEMSIGNTGVNAGNYASKLYNKYTAVAAVAYGLKETISALITPFRDFEYQMDKVNAVSGANAKQMQELEANARKLGETTEYTAAQVAQLQLNYARLGFNPDEILNVTQATLDLATATGEDLAKSADIAGATLRGFGLDAKEMPRVVDVMANSFNKSALSLDNFTESMKYVAPIAKTAGVSLEQTTAMLGILADRGIRGSQAGTALRRILTEISLSGKTVSEALADLNAKGLSVSDAMDEVGRYAMTALTVLSENAPAVENLSVQLNNSAGAAQNAAKIMRDNLKGDTDKAISALQELAITIGERLAPYIRAVIQGFTLLVQNIQVATFTVLGYIAATKGVILVKTLWRNITIATTAVTAAETVTISTQILALRSASAATKLLTAAKLLFTGQVKAATIAIKMFGVAMKSTGIGLAIAALAGLVTWYFSAEKSASAAEIAQQRVNKAHEEFATKQNERKSRAEELITVSKSENESLLARAAAFRELQALYPNILQNYTLESFLLEDIGKLRKKMADSDANRKLVQDNKNLEESTKSLIESRQKLDNISQSYQGKTVFGRLGVDKLRDEVNVAEKVMAEFYKTVQQNKQDLEATQPVEVQIATLDKNIADFEAQLKQLNALTSQGFVTPFQQELLRRQQEDAEKKKAALSKSQKEIANLESSLRKLSDAELEKRASESENKEEKRIAKQILKERAKSKKLAQEREKAAKEYADTLKATNAQILAQDNALIDAEIALMDEGVAKKIAASNQSFKKQSEARDKQYQDELAKIEEQQKKLGKSSPEYKTLETGKQTLTDNYEPIKTKDTEVEAKKRLDILRAASVEELAIYERTVTTKEAKDEFERAITQRRIKAEVDAEKKKSKKIIDAQSKTIVAVKSAEDNYALQKRIIEQTSDTTTREGRRKLKEETIKNEVEVLKAKANAYIAELQMLQSLGQVDTDRYNEILTALTKVKAQAEGVGKGESIEGPTAKTSILDDIFNEFSKPENIEKLTAAAFDLASQINQAMADAEKQGIDRRLKQEQKKIDDESNSAKKALEDKRKRGLISEKAYQNGLAKIDDEADKRREAAERKAFEDKKKVDTKMAIIDTLMAIGKAFATMYWPQALVTSAILTAQGAVRVATIQSQKYALGGIVPVGESGDGISMGQVKGPSHTQGGLRITIGGKPVGEMEGDEILAIINKNSANRYLPQLSKINKAGGGVKFATGGIIPSASYRIPSPVPIVYPKTSSSDDRYMQETMRMLAQTIKDTQQSVEATNSRIDRLGVFITQTDISDSLQDQKRIKALTTF